MQHVYVVGSKGIPGSYGGYETFLDKLTEYHQNNANIKYHIACKANGDGVSPELNAMPLRFKYHNADCFKVQVPEVGSAQAIIYDCRALEYCIKHIAENNIENPIVYVLACRIGPFFSHYVNEIHRLGGKVFVNPDGHEWMRAKWSKPVREYWRISEALMVKYADLLICDSKNIEKYIQETYKKYNPQTTYIAYGAETKPSTLDNESPELLNWYDEHNLRIKEYYLMVGRFVPENNFETIIREFMKSDSKKDLAIITTNNAAFLKELDERLNFSEDSRIKFVGTVYNQELLKKIRENAYGYVHGHSVGGTNPSLLEALGATDLNLLLDVGFNKECAEDGALYWNKEEGNLSALFNKSDNLDKEDISLLAQKAKKRIVEAYSWKFISNRYEEVLINAEATSRVASSIAISSIKSA
ncbi:MAG: DUF1972 domain-containing protein [Butyrivibrio sp.]|uniref:beta 1-4 rhamnosyltransferase Cps2T n=1 Tax=Butyrivibrio sp. TaxID=28121 RepID=UPI0025EE083D|nr:DUF1972 domain-containing protein [Butyrivibrio sp.]MCR5770840.1 DUF1972 domain-containing protein [Butyrivibrio sp.]